MTTTAAIYTRISQDQTGQAVGVANQLEACRAFIKAKGWTEGKLYSDNDISATTGKLRPAFEELLKDAPPVVVAWEQSRLSRGTMDTLRIKAAGITGYITDGGKLDFSSADAEFMTMIRTHIDEAEGRKKAERQKLRNLGDAKAGKVFLRKRPFGNNLDGSLNEPEAKAVLESAKKLVTEEMSFNDVAKDWNSKGLFTPKSKNSGGKPWHSAGVKRFYDNERLIAKRTYEGITYDLKDWTPLLDEELFQQVKTKIESEATGQRGIRKEAHRNHLLTGIAVCGEEGCNGKLSIAYSGKNGVRRYKCLVSGHPAKVADKFENYVLLQMFPLLAAKNADAVLNPDSPEGNLAALRTQKARMELEHAEWLEEALEASLKPSVIAAKEAKHEAAVKALGERIAELNRENLFGELLEDMPWDLEKVVPYLYERWATVPLARQREIIKAMFTRVAILRGDHGKRFQADKVILEPSELALALAESIDNEIQELLKRFTIS